MCFAFVSVLRNYPYRGHSAVVNTEHLHKFRERDIPASKASVTDVITCRVTCPTDGKSISTCQSSTTFFEEGWENSGDGSQLGIASNDNVSGYETADVEGTPMNFNHSSPSEIDRFEKAIEDDEDEGTASVTPSLISAYLLKITKLHDRIQDLEEEVQKGREKNDALTKQIDEHSNNFRVLCMHYGKLKQDYKELTRENSLSNEVLIVDKACQTNPDANQEVLGAEEAQICEPPSFELPGLSDEDVYVVDTDAIYPRSSSASTFSGMCPSCKRKIDSSHFYDSFSTTPGFPSDQQSSLDVEPQDCLRTANNRQSDIAGATTLVQHRTIIVPFQESAGLTGPDDTSSSSGSSLRSRSPQSASESKLHGFEKQGLLDVVLSVMLSCSVPEIWTKMSDALSRELLRGSTWLTNPGPRPSGFSEGRIHKILVQDHVQKNLPKTKVMLFPTSSKDHAGNIWLNHVSICTCILIRQEKLVSLRDVLHHSKMKLVLGPLF